MKFMLELDLDLFNNDWDILQKFLERRGNPPYVITGDINFLYADIKSLGNLQCVEGMFDIRYSTIKSLGGLHSVGMDFNLYGTKIECLENVQSVGGYLNLYDSDIKSLGNLKFVGGDLLLRNSPLSKKITKEEIRSRIVVGGNIYL